LGGQRQPHGHVIDGNTAVEDAKHTVVVIDAGNNGCTIYCDPNIINR
jgi:hypothetical protein